MASDPHDTDAAEEYRSTVATQEKAISAKVYATGGARLNTRNRRFRGKEFFNQNRTRARTSIKSMARMDPETGQYDVNNCTSDPAEMAEIGCQYFEHLFKPRVLRKDIQDVMLSELQPMEHQLQVVLGRNMTVREIEMGIRLMKGETAAGDDTTITEFYQAHKHLWARLFLKVFAEARRLGELPEWMLKRNMSLLFKKNDPRLLANYRGLSLLTRGFLLLSTIIALRMRRPASLFCDSTQTAFRPGPLLTDNLSTIVDTFCYANDSKQEALGVAEDALKYYDLICPYYGMECVKVSMCTQVAYEASFASWVVLLLFGGLLAVVIEGCTSRTVPQLSGFAQGMGLACLLSMLTEAPRSSMLRKTAEEWQALKERHPMIAELQRIVAVKKMETPDGAGEVSYKYADDRWGFMILGSLAAYMAIGKLCQLGGGGTINYDKTNVSKLGLGHGGATLKEADDVGIRFAPSTTDVEVTGIQTGYSKDLVLRMWEDKIMKGVKALRTWGKVRLYRSDRAVVFRTFVMSIWSWLADPVPPAASQVKKMEAIQRRYLLKGGTPTDAQQATGGKVTTYSKVSTGELARPTWQGGSGIPRVSEILDAINVKKVQRLMDPREQTQQWTAYIFWWSQQVLVPWGAVAMTGPAKMPGALALCNFLCRYRVRGNMMTLSPRVPQHWRMRFRSFFRAVEKGSIRTIADPISARAEPLWYNSLLQTERGFPDSTEFPEAVWKGWAQRGFCAVSSITRSDGTIRTEADIRAQLPVWKSDWARQYAYLVQRVMASPIGAALCSNTIPRNWWLEFDTGLVWHYDGMWRAYKPQTMDRFWVGGSMKQAWTSERLADGTLRCDFGGQQQWCQPKERVCLEPWSSAQLELMGYRSPGTAVMVPCEASWQQTKEYSALIGPAIWTGATMEWAAATIDNMEWTTEAGRSLWGKEALQEMIRVAWVPAEQHLSHRTWEVQGGPKPRWGKLFHVLTLTAMPGWIRDEAWNVLSGNVWWGFDRLKWAPSTANCGYCAGEGVTAIETASHFACCPRWRLLWQAVSKTLQAGGLLVPVQEWFVLYGPEAGYYRKDQYDTATWIWAVMIQVMMKCRREMWESDRTVTTHRHMVSKFRSQLVEACRAEHVAATKYKVPVSVTAGRWGARQTRNQEAWQRRWRGLGQLQRGKVVWFNDEGFDTREAAGVMALYMETGDTLPFSSF